MVLGKHAVVAVCCFGLLPAANAESQSHGSFSDYVELLQQQAINKGISTQTIEEVFPKIKMFKKASVSVNKTADAKETLDTFLPRAVPRSKVDTARAIYKQHYQKLVSIGKRYGVQPRFIVAFWGIDANFGQSSGNYSVLSVTASLAYEGKRESFYQEQFFQALAIAERDNIPFESLTGTSSGKLGLNQFDPSQYLLYAQDGDDDGKIDIWNNPIDAFASTAYYLQQNGWNDSQTWGRQVKVPKDFEPYLASLQVAKSFLEWQSLGVTRFDGGALPSRNDMQVSMVMPDGASGRKYLIYDNYRSIRSWTDSDYFAISVSYLSEKIKFPAVI